MAAPTWDNPVKSFFRQFDIDSMKDMGINLGDYDSVRANAQPIYDRTSAGDMPCDGPWPPDRVATFKQWMDAGCPKS